MCNFVPKTTFFDKLEGQQFWTPERKLLLGVLKRAILDYIGAHESKARHAEDWIFEDKVEFSEERFTFPWLCEQLDIEIKELMAAIGRMDKGQRLRLNTPRGPLWGLYLSGVLNINPCE